MFKQGKKMKPCPKDCSDRKSHFFERKGQKVSCTNAGWIYIIKSR